MASHTSCIDKAALQNRPVTMPFGSLLITVSHAQDGTLAQGGADDLQADGHPLGKATWKGYTADSGQIENDG